MNSAEKNNRVYLNGEIVSEAAFSHEVYGEGFYEMSVLVKRLSGQADILPVTISERLIQDKQLGIGSEISAIGQFRSYNKLVDGKSKLMLTVFVRELLEGEAQKNPNSIVLSGYICKQPVYRTTPFNREIADLLVEQLLKHLQPDQPATETAWIFPEKSNSNLIKKDKENNR